MLDIVQVTSDEPKDATTDDKAKPAVTWMDLCKLFGSHFVQKNGIYKTGSFDNFTCFSDLKSRSLGKQSDWVLQVIGGDDSQNFVLKYRDKLVSQMEIGSIGDLNVFLQEPEVRALLALGIMNQMPFLWIENAKINKSISLKDDFVFKKLKRPPMIVEVIYYTLRLNKGEWQPNGLGMLTIDVAALNAKIPAGVNEPRLFVHDVRGPGQLTPEIKIQLEKYAEETQGNFLMRSLKYIPLGFSGARYGVQVGRDSGLFKKSKYIAVLLEARGGIINGLRYYYEKIPEIFESVTLNGGIADEAKISMSKHTLGYSFGYDPGKYLPRVTFDGKLGIWSLDSRLEADSNAEELVDFKLQNAMSVAGELGLEVFLKYGYIRGWYSRDLGYSPVQSKTKIVSSKYGLDGRVPFGANKRGKLLVSALGFAFFESVGLSKVEDDARTDVNYSLATAGVGLGIQW
jgi:hypothetical protein